VFTCIRYFLRQDEAGLNRIILLAFLSIILTCGYEGVITTLTFAPSPPKAFHTFKDLIDNGYKLGFMTPSGYGNNSVEDILALIKYYRSMFVENDILDKINKSFMDMSPIYEFGGKASIAAALRIILPISLTADKFSMLSYFLDNGTSKCFGLKNPLELQSIQITFTGYFGTKFLQELQACEEKGLLDFWERFSQFWYIRALRREYKTTLVKSTGNVYYCEEEHAFKPMSLNSKPMSVFRVSGISVLCSVVIFTAEHCVKYLSIRVVKKFLVRGLKSFVDSVGVLASNVIKLIG